jgi:uridine kinase
MFTALVRRIRDLLHTKEFVLIAIDGYGGAGKTTLARQIQKEFAESQIITLDDFATDTTSGADRTRFLAQVLRPLSQNQPARYQRYSWKERALTDRVEVPARGLVIVEGVSVIGVDFASYYDLRIWINCSLELAQQRLRERERAAGREFSLENWFNVWEKEDEDYGRTEPWKRADIIVPVMK